MPESSSCALQTSVVLAVRIVRSIAFNVLIFWTRPFGGDRILDLIPHLYRSFFFVVPCFSTLFCCRVRRTVLEAWSFHCFTWSSKSQSRQRAIGYPRRTVPQYCHVGERVWPLQNHASNMVSDFAESQPPYMRSRHAQVSADRQGSPASAGHGS